jgi:hypothetical protein
MPYERESPPVGRPLHTQHLLFIFRSCVVHAVHARCRRTSGVVVESAWVGCLEATNGRECVKSPRFLFVLGVGKGVAAHPVWPDLHQPFEGETDSDGSWFAWRLTGANHRELGRSSRVYPDLASARDAVVRLQARIQEAEVAVLNVPRTGTWGWRLRLDDEPVATSSRSYSRHRECTYSVSAFLTAASTAGISEGYPPTVPRPV